MAKRQAIDTPLTTQLIVSREEFKKHLHSRVLIGQELLDRPISTGEDWEQLTNENGAWNFYNSEYLKVSFNKPDNEYKRKYDMTGFSIMGRIGTFTNGIDDATDLLANRINALKNLISIIPILPVANNIEVADDKKANREILALNEVFVVHGHDEEAKTKVARFVEKLGFKPIILHEQPSSGFTIIEKMSNILMWVLELYFIPLAILEAKNQMK